MIEVWFDRKKAVLLSIIRDSPDGTVSPDELTKEAYRRDRDLWSGGSNPLNEAWFLVDTGEATFNRDWNLCLPDHPTVENLE